MSHRTSHYLPSLLVFTMLLVGCGSEVAEPSASPGPTEPPAPTVPPSPEPTATLESKAVRSLEDVKSAVIQIEAQGSFVDPEFGLQLNTGGLGSGFIIDETGIAITNNHVVTGAALLKVWVGGEPDPMNAKVLGISECSDLAIIDIEGEGFPYLEWFDGKVNVGLDVYTAGFPLGDPEFTLTRGIISKERAGGDTSWASVDSALEHDATINPGNSGGPLVNAEGQVVGINYAGDDSALQYFAIARAEALRVVDQLRAGQDVDSIGVNGEAIDDGDGLTGIWVYSVQSGSPAGEAGLKGGDIITSMEGLLLATDGTMADYCDILRSHNPDDTMSIEVLRYDTEEMLEGQLNGRALEPTFLFASTVDTGGDSDAGSDYTDYVWITDDYGVIEIEVPVEWAEVDGSPWLLADGETDGAGITAAADVDSYWETWAESGMAFAASSQLVTAYSSPGILLDAIADLSEDCELLEHDDYEDSLYIGEYDWWDNCGGQGTGVVEVAAVPIEDPTAFMLYVQVQIVSHADLVALDRILASFQVVGELPSGGTVGDFSDYVPPEGYAVIIDDSDAITVEVPVEWDDVDGSPWIIEEGGEIVGAKITASADLQTFVETYNEPGVMIAVSNQLFATYPTPENILDGLGDFSRDCLFVRDDYKDTQYVGKQDVWSCDGQSEEEVLIVTAGVPVDDPTAHMVFLVVQLNLVRDWDVYDHIIESVYVSTGST